jgi:TonB family protein
MRRLPAFLGALIIAAVLLPPPRATQRRESRLFKEVELLTAGELVHPFNSLAYGTVATEVTVSSAGAVKSVHVIRDVAPLTSEAIRDVMVWTFKPATLDGKNISSRAAIILVFSPPLNNPPVSPLPPAGQPPEEQNQGVEFSPPQVTDVVYPRYPINSEAQGTVILQTTVGLSGQVETVKVVRDITSLTSEAIGAVKRWKFQPGTVDGEAVRSNAIVAILFTRPAYF